MRGGGQLGSLNHLPLKLQLQLTCYRRRSFCLCPSAVLAKAQEGAGAAEFSQDTGASSIFKLFKLIFLFYHNPFELLIIIYFVQF